jgi:predicted phage terminase large subunit-like protein
VLAVQLERLIHGDLALLVIAEPPRHGKSEMVSRLLPAYYLYLWPKRWVGLSSYGADLAEALSRKARDYFVGQRNENTASAARWETAAGGGMWATGVGGAATGKGGHLLVCDDPVKDASEAESLLIRQRNKDWWDATWFTRREPPHRSALLTMTRWHFDDVAGHVLTTWVPAMAEDGVHIIHLPALAEDREAVEALYPNGVTIEPDWRQPGEPLCPERFTTEALAQIRGGTTDYYWSALYQQRPVPRGGGMFPRERVEFVGAAPAEAVSRVRYWDKAGTAGGGAYTAGVLLSVARTGLVTVEHVVRGQWAEFDRENIIKQTALLDGRSVLVAVEQEPGSSGQDSVNATIRNLAGFKVRADRVTGDKTLRAEPLAAQWQAGNVRLVEGDWTSAFLSEAETFPAGSFRDQIDAAGGAYRTALDLVGKRPLVAPIVSPRYPVFAV